ncbi:MAG: septum formation inhibitor Maf [Clostridiales bacterium]|nr:MAG: septum formation inhibitor Maf [Clostridiales bacterium]
MKIILASASPRRKDILSQVGMDFEIRVSNADENNVHGTPSEVVKTLALRKANAVLCKSGEFIVSADTVVSVDGLIMNKPENDDDAKRMLTMLSGRAHDVFTGVCVKCPDSRIFSDVCKTKVFFRTLEEKEIDNYIKTGEPKDKAGAYGIQGKGALFIEKIDGDYNNVVGLPVVTLYKLLKNAGVSF